MQDASLMWEELIAMSNSADAMPLFMDDLNLCKAFKMNFLANKEKIISLETENAILHLQVAQLHNTFKSQLKRQSQITPAAYHDHQLRQLMKQVKQLKQDVRTLQIEYRVHQRTIQEVASTALNSIVHKYKIKVADFNDIWRKYEEEKAKRKELHNELIELRGNIRVHCRVRPLRDIDKGSTSCIECIDDETVSVEHFQSSHRGSRITEKLFNFDKVYRPEDSQETVFADVQPLLTSLLDGYNVCIMAYGQTGGGKTHTMLGGGGDSSTDLSGVLPLATAELFRMIDEKMVNCDVSVTVIEIYNEKVRDLLSSKPGFSHHDVIFEQNGEVEVTNLTERVVLSEDELLSVVTGGMKHRATHCTNVHEHSSRSHLLVTVHLAIGGEGVSSRSSCSSVQLNTTITPVTSTDSTPVVSPSSSPPEQQYLYSQHGSRFSRRLSATGSRGSRSHDTATLSHVKLQLVDLAGSECVGQSDVHGTQLKETQHINKSLCALSDVLTALADKRSHVPYRNSTLTHILQDSIGGKAKMLMFLCLSPTSRHSVESLRVLGFGVRARQVQRPQGRREGGCLGGLSTPFVSQLATCLLYIIRHTLPAEVCPEHLLCSKQCSGLR